MDNDPSAPAVSIILPTYNRAGFLPASFKSIRDQSFIGWELLIVDDGSTDETQRLVADLSRGMDRPVRYIHQKNQGAYGARNTGLDHARGEYIAFYDSDDLWLPHHLADCVAVLEANPDVDWVYGACRMVDFLTGNVLAPNTFYKGDQPRPFLKLRVRKIGRSSIIEDKNANRVMILHGLYCGLQNSVIRRRIFEANRFRVRPRHEAEDQLVVMRALAASAKLAYFDQVHVVYHVHLGNSSAASGGTFDKLFQITRQLVHGLEELGRQEQLSGPERRALRRRLGREYFWLLGYAMLWNDGRRRDALAMFRRALLAWPYDFRCWKTYALARLRVAFSTRVETPAPPQSGRIPPETALPDAALTPEGPR